VTIPVQKPTSTVSTYEPLLLRHPANPILTSKNWPYPINSVFNAGATLLADGYCFAACRIGAACRISVPRALGTVLTDGKLIKNPH
jgi:hypothetical protein